jgi:hypothetical protein
MRNEPRPSYAPVDNAFISECACPLLAAKRTCWSRLTMSAAEGKTDVPREPAPFRFDPLPTFLGDPKSEQDCG